VLLGLVAAAFLLPSLFNTSDGTELQYSQFIEQAQNGNVKSIEWNNENGHINGEFADGAKFTTTGVPSPPGPSETDRALFAEHHIDVKFKTPETSFWAAWLPLLLHRALEGEDVHDRAARHDVRRRGRLRGREAGDP
jgi:ATP-dependent Zn protease